MFVEILVCMGCVALVVEFLLSRNQLSPVETPAVLPGQLQYRQKELLDWNQTG
jgi:hypothetical protein